MSASAVERLGGETMRQVEYVGGLAIQLGNVLGALTRTLPLVGKRSRWRSAVRQMLEVGVDAFPMVGIMAACAGFILAMQGASELHRFGAMNFVVDLVTIGFTRALGPLYLRYARGIAPGSEVLFGGMEAGKVTSVRPWNRDPTQIEIALEVKEGTPLNEKSTARLGSISLMSSPAISITTGAQDAPRLKPGVVIASQETLTIDDMTRKLSGIADDAAGLITQVKSELKGISGRANTLLANLNETTGPANREQLAGILRQVNAMVARQSPKIDQITDQVLRVSRDADSTMKKMDPLLEHTDATVGNVNTTIDQLRDPLRADLAQLQTTMEQAKSLIASLQTTVRANDDNIHDTIENLRIATENLDELSDQVKQRPWSLVRIRQPKDRKVPQ